MWVVAGLLLGCRTAPAPAPQPPQINDLPAAPCPPGMVLVEGSGTVGMRGQPYGVVPTAHLDRVDQPEAGCPAALQETPGAVSCWVQTDEVDPVLPERAVTVTPFCIDAWPHPGAGHAYSKDGLTASGAQALGKLLAEQPLGGRRLCTMTEFQAAVAGLQANRRFIYGDDAPGSRCGTDSLVVGPIGGDPACHNPETGTHDYGAVLSHWVVADRAFLATACTDAAGGCLGAGNRRLQPGDPIVAGGTRRAWTRQAPLTPHTWHDHGQPGGGCTADLTWDDQPVICADPDPSWLTGGRQEEEQRWRRLVAQGLQAGSMTALLEAGLGKDWCQP